MSTNKWYSVYHKEVYEAMVAKGHSPKMEETEDETLKLDIFVLDTDSYGEIGHNGPGCKNCYFSFCEHCHPLHPPAYMEECDNEKLVDTAV